MSEEGIENGYKIVKDLTEEVRKVTENFYRFPKDLKILEAKLLVGSDGRGGVERYLYIEYEFDSIIYKKQMPVYANLKNLIIDVVFEILKHYISMHLE